MYRTQNKLLVCLLIAAMMFTTCMPSLAYNISTTVPSSDRGKVGIVYLGNGVQPTTNLPSSDEEIAEANKQASIDAQAWLDNPIASKGNGTSTVSGNSNEIGNDTFWVGMYISGLDKMDANLNTIEVDGTGSDSSRIYSLFLHDASTGETNTNTGIYKTATYMHYNGAIISQFNNISTTNATQLKKAPHYGAAANNVGLMTISASNRKTDSAYSTTDNEETTPILEKVDASNIKVFGLLDTYNMALLKKFAYDDGSGEYYEDGDYDSVPTDVLYLLIARFQYNSDASIDDGTPILDAALNKNDFTLLTGADDDNQRWGAQWNTDRDVTSTTNLKNYLDYAGAPVFFPNKYTVSYHDSADVYDNTELSNGLTVTWPDGITAVSEDDGTNGKYYNTDTDKVTEGKTLAGELGSETYTDANGFLKGLTAVDGNSNKLLLKGWTTDSTPDSSSMLFKGTDSVSSSDVDGNGVLHLYAVWGEGYEVKLDPNEGSWDADNTLVGVSEGGNEIATLAAPATTMLTASGGSLYISGNPSDSDYVDLLPTVSRTGYNFLGWAESADANAYATKTVSGNEYSLKFDDSQSAADEKQNMKLIQYLKAKDDYESETLYAVWEPTSKDYTVTFHMNAAEDDDVSESTPNDAAWKVYDGSITYDVANGGTLGNSVPNPVRKVGTTAEYKLLGWAKTSNATAAEKTSAEMSALEISANADYYAVWSTEDVDAANKADITFNGNNAADWDAASDGITSKTISVISGGKLGPGKAPDLPITQTIGGKVYTAVGYSATRITPGDNYDASTDLLSDDNLADLTAPSTVYVVWAEGYTVSFYPNNGSEGLEIDGDTSAKETDTAPYTFRKNHGIEVTAADTDLAKAVAAATVDTTKYTSNGVEYTFKGWADKPNPKLTDPTPSNNDTIYTDAAGLAGAITVNTDAKFYAVWEPQADKKITITYNVNGVTATLSASDTYTAALGDVLLSSMMPDTPTATGYTFTGWNTEKNGSGTAYAAGDTVSDGVDTTANTLTLYAQWKGSTSETGHVYAIAGEHGTIAPLDAKVFGETTNDNARDFVVNKSGTTVTDGIPADWMPTVTPATGYATTGWEISTDTTGGKDGTWTDYTPGDDITLDATNFNAYLKPAYVEKVVFTFKLNGGAINSDNTDQTVSFEPSHVLEDADFKDLTDIFKVDPATATTGVYRENYIFGGWATSANGPAVYPIDLVTIGTDFTAPLYDGTTTEAKDVTDTTLYAHWTASGTVGTDVAKLTFHADNMGVTGFTFTNPSPLTIYTGAKPAKAAVGATYWPADPTKTGYTFDGWYLDAACTGTAQDATSEYEAGEYDLYAKWTYTGADAVTITFKTQSGPTVSAADSTPYPDAVYIVAPETILDDDVFPADPYWAGYGFDGWYVEADVDKTAHDWYTPSATGTEITGTYAAPTSTGSAQAIVIYAVWTEEISFTFNAGAGSFTTAPTTNPIKKLPTDSIDDLSSFAVTAPTGFVFERWNTHEDGTGVDIEEQTSPDTVADIRDAIDDYNTEHGTDDSNTNITVYAIYAADTTAPYVTIVFDENGGDTTIADATLPVSGASPNGTASIGGAGAAVKIPAGPVKDGYTFKGWFADPVLETTEIKEGGTEGSETPYTFEGLVDTDNDDEFDEVTVYAHWAADTDSSYWTVEFYNNADASDTSNGTKIAEMTIADGDTISAFPTVLVERNFFTLSGAWKTSEEYTVTAGATGTQINSSTPDIDTATKDGNMEGTLRVFAEWEASWYVNTLNADIYNNKDRNPAYSGGDSKSGLATAGTIQNYSEGTAEDFTDEDDETISPEWGTDYGLAFFSDAAKTTALTAAPKNAGTYYFSFVSVEKTVPDVIDIAGDDSYEINKVPLVFALADGAKQAYTKSQITGTNTNELELVASIKTVTDDETGDKVPVVTVDGLTGDDLAGVTTNLFDINYGLITLTNGATLTKTAADAGKIVDADMSIATLSATAPYHATDATSLIGKYLAQIALTDDTNYEIETVDSGILLYTSASPESDTMISTYKLDENGQNIYYEITVDMVLSGIAFTQVDEDGNEIASSDVPLNDAATMDGTVTSFADTTKDYFAGNVDPENGIKIVFTGVLPDTDVEIDFLSKSDVDDDMPTASASTKKTLVDNGDGTYTLIISADDLNSADGFKDNTKDMADTFMNQLVVKLGSSDTYTFNIRKLAEAKIELAYGNSPAGLIYEKHKSDTDDGAARDAELATFDTDRTYDGLGNSVVKKYYPQAWDSYKAADIAAGTAPTIQSGNVDFNGGEDYDGDMDPTAMFVYQRKDFRDAGFTATDSYGDEVDFANITISFTATEFKGGFVAYTSADNAAPVVVSTTPDSNNPLYNDLSEKDIRPDVYVMTYSFDDEVEGEIAVERKLIVISRLGDVRIDANDTVNNLDAAMVISRLDDFSNSLYTFRMADVRYDDNVTVNNLDSARIISSLDSLSDDHFYKSLPRV